MDGEKTDWTLFGVACVVIVTILFQSLAYLDLYINAF